MTKGFYICSENLDLGTEPLCHKGSLSAHEKIELLMAMTRPSDGLLLYGLDGEDFEPKELWKIGFRQTFIHIERGIFSNTIEVDFVGIFKSAVGKEIEILVQESVGNSKAAREAMTSCLDHCKNWNRYINYN